MMKFKATQANIYLHHLAINSQNPECLADFYADVMDMTKIRFPNGDWGCEGPRRKVIFPPGENQHLAYAGFACRDRLALERLRTHLKQQAVAILPSPSVYFSKDAFAVSDPDNHIICFGVADTEDKILPGLPGPIQHLTFASLEVEPFQKFYHEKLGFEITDRVLHQNGSLATCFTTANHEHHTIACFKSNRRGIDHHSYEAGNWLYIRDWCDHFAAHNISLMWGPGRHGPGNNLFIFIEDPDGNWIEVSAELETIYGRPTKDWPQTPRTLNLWGKAIMRS